MTNKKAPTEVEAETMQGHPIANDSAAQRKLLYSALLKGPVTTLEARRDHDVMHPAARIQELRERGFNIITHWESQETQPGRVHRVACYVLLTQRVQ